VFSAGGTAAAWQCRSVVRPAALLAIAALAWGTPAAADDGACLDEWDVPDGYLVTATPASEHPWEPYTGDRRIAFVQRAITAGEDDAVALATWRLELADLHGGKGRQLYIRYLQDAVQSDTARGPKRAALRASADRFKARATLAFAQAAAEYAELFCDPADRDDLACAPHPALRGWAPLDDGLARFAAVLRYLKRDADVELVAHRQVELFPDTRNAPAATLALAEAAFARGDHGEAEALYERAAAIGDAKLAEYARYMTGWTALRSDRPAEAFERFAALTSTGPRGRRGPIIVRTARTDLVVAFACYGEPEDAYAAFDEAAPSHALDLLDELALRWGFAGRVDAAVAVFDEYRRHLARSRELLAPALGLGALVEVASPR
jgi:hypothetical protein